LPIVVHLQNVARDHGRRVSSLGKKTGKAVLLHDCRKAKLLLSIETLGARKLRLIFFSGSQIDDRSKAKQKVRLFNRLAIFKKRQHRLPPFSDFTEPLGLNRRLACAEQHAASDFLSRQEKSKRAQLRLAHAFFFLSRAQRFL
jgi:hypothetical protein